MEQTLNFEVKENSLQEFAEKYFVNIDRPQDFGRSSKEQLNPYYILGRQEIFVRKNIIDVIEKDPVIKFTLSDLSNISRATLLNTYQYSIEKYDDVLLKLVLIDFKVENVK